MRLETLVFPGVLDAGGSAVDNLVDMTGWDYVVVDVIINGSAGHTYPANLTFNGVNVTPLGDAIAQGNLRLRGYHLLGPTQGEHTLRFDPGAGFATTPYIIVVTGYNEVPEAGSDYTPAQGADAVGQLDSLVTGVSETGALLHVCHAVQGNNVASGAATGFTGRANQVVDSGTGDIGAVTGEAAGAASVPTSVAWTGPASISYAAYTLSIPQEAATGPTITDQPDAAEVDEGDPAVFSVAATGTGTLSYQWQRDSGAGYVNLSDGGAIAGATTDELTVDPTTLAMDGDLFRCVVTDDNGSTNSNGAELGVNGTDQLTQPGAATDAEGEAAGSLSSTLLPTAPATYRIARITATIDAVEIDQAAYVFVANP